MAAQTSNEISAYTGGETCDDVSHQRISSYFIGPQAENMSYFKDNIAVILEEVEAARTSYFPKDGKFISKKVQKTPGFIKSMNRLNNAVRKAANILGKTSIPFWSPRYEAHMCTDMSMASLLGYFMTMIYNPNNVAIEASPLSTVAEIEVGEQLCELFGYNTKEDNPDAPVGWGHVTCDGTVANLEIMYSHALTARNLKFYPLSLREAMKKGAPLDFMADKFYVENCQGKQRLFSALTDWELLNLKPNDILDIPDRLYQEHGISNAFLSDVMEKFTIQSTGKDTLEQKYGMAESDMAKPCLYMLANTRHYSWPKGAAIAGIGSDNVVGIAVNDAARIDIEALEKELETRRLAGQAVYAVVAIMGSTEEGAVDSLSSILALRKQFQAKGMSFLVHADAAWGGYFCSMLPKNYRPGDVINYPTQAGKKRGFVPDASLRVETQEDLYAMRFADSITVDPHKAGYIPYPAGGLCYRDGRMRFLVTWTSPYLSRGSVTSIGIYGVEGSKPGASAVSTWLSNKTIGLNQEGYGSLLGEVTWTCTRLSAEWAAMTKFGDRDGLFVCVPFNKLPCEHKQNVTHGEIDAEKTRIKNEIVNKSNKEIVDSDVGRDDDSKAMKLMRDLGSDLNINAFSLNFRHSNGDLNKDIEEANYLMQRVVEALSVDSPGDDPTKIPLYLTSTTFSDKLYGKCKENFAKRLGLEKSTQELMVLRNVVMSPFPTEGRFIGELADIFRDTVNREAKIVRRRNEVSEDLHSFLMQGTEQVHLIHLPMFHVANHRQQLIVAVDIVDDVVKQKYKDLKEAYSTEPMILVTQQKELLRNIVATEGSFIGQIMTKESGIIMKNVIVKVTRDIVNRPLNSKFRLAGYPKKFMPFYLYGSSAEANIDHIIVRAPNTQLSAGRCTLNLPGGPRLDAEFWKKDLVLTVTNVYEAPMQPFPPNAEIGTKHGAVIRHEHHQHNDSGSGPEPKKGAAIITSETRSGKMRGSGFFFRPGAVLQVNVWEDGNRRQAQTVDIDGFDPKEPAEGVTLLGSGTLTLGESVFVDSEAMNFDPFKKVDKVAEWRHEFSKIGQDLD
ncbi:pyridoxal phosphate-dependent transferase [Microdochium bolleyi]|uniref:Pyridoxal phosphate-dependent transferase n=1 Tax=Microdochium bolleyi TaxID=196109 RepID=A0A136ILE2_9PEZI|nr:pyridoxal phosphate-dependent transferase [Microdochium bolleyi]